MRCRVWRVLAIHGVLSLHAACTWAQTVTPPPGPGSLVQWRDTGWTLADVLGMGYEVVAASDMADGGQFISTIYLKKGPDLVKCRETHRPFGNKTSIQFCVRAVQPYLFGNQPPSGQR